MQLRPADDAVKLNDAAQVTGRLKSLAVDVQFRRDKAMSEIFHGLSPFAANV